MAEDKEMQSARLCIKISWKNGIRTVKRDGQHPQISSQIVAECRKH